MRPCAKLLTALQWKTRTPLKSDAPLEHTDQREQNITCLLIYNELYNGKTGRPYTNYEIKTKYLLCTIYNIGFCAATCCAYFTEVPESKASEASTFMSRSVSARRVVDQNNSYENDRHLCMYHNYTSYSFMVDCLNRCAKNIKYLLCTQ